MGQSLSSSARDTRFLNLSYSPAQKDEGSDERIVAKNNRNQKVRGERRRRDQARVTRDRERERKRMRKRVGEEKERGAAERE